MLEVAPVFCSLGPDSVVVEKGKKRGQIGKYPDDLSARFARRIFFFVYADFLLLFSQMRSLVPGKVFSHI